jgi:site-specific recombinase XerD
MSAGLRTEHLQSILFVVTRSALCASYGVTTLAKPTCLFRSAADRSFHHLVARLGKAAKMPFAVHPHMLRHACGFKLANDGHDTRALQHYLGHKNIQHTVRYTEMSPDRFRDFWR